NQGANVLTMRFAPDGKSVACGDSNGLVKIWDVGSGRLRVTAVRHRAPVVALAWARGGRAVAWCGLDGALRTIVVAPPRGPAKLRPSGSHASAPRQAVGREQPRISVRQDRRSPPERCVAVPAEKRSTGHPGVTDTSTHGNVEGY